MANIAKMVFIASVWLYFINTFGAISVGAESASKSHRKRKLIKKFLKRSPQTDSHYESSYLSDDLVELPGRTGETEVDTDDYNNGKLQYHAGGPLHQHNLHSRGSAELSSDEKKHLEKLYGEETVKSLEADFASVKELGDKDIANSKEHKILWDAAQGKPVAGINKKLLDEARLELDAVNAELVSQDAANAQHGLADPNEGHKHFLNPSVVKSLLANLLEKLDTLEEDSVENDITQPVVMATHGHCNLHGLWLSTVAGAAIELLPEQKEGRIEVNTKIFDLPDSPQRGLITSEWTGKGMISSESPTTLTMVFQEHLQKKPNGDEGFEEERDGELTPLPKTAVFVGQCLVCQNSPVLQGTWVVFPSTQNCLPAAGNFLANSPKPDETKHTTKDTFYRLTN